MLNRKRPRVWNFIALILGMLFTTSVGQAQLIYSNDFEGLVGSEWFNTNVETTPNNLTRFLGRFSAQTVRLRLTNLPAHSQLTIALDLYIILTMDGNYMPAPYGPDVVDISVVGGANLLHATFANNIDGTRFWQSYPDRYDPIEVVNHPPRTGATAINTLGYYWSAPDFTGPLDATYRLVFTIPHTDNNISLDFSGIGMEGIGTEAWGIDNLQISIPEITFTGTVKLGGWVGTGTPLNAIPINLKVDDKAAQTIYLSPTNNADTGTFSIQLPTTGTHRVSIKPINYLAQTVTLTANHVNISANFDGPNGNGLVPGDAANTNYINDFDLISVIFEFGRIPGSITGNPYTDTNGDGRVDDYDLVNVIFGFGKEGDQ